MRSKTKTMLIWILIFVAAGATYRFVQARSGDAPTLNAQPRPRTLTTVHSIEVTANGTPVAGRIVGFSCVDLGRPTQGEPIVKCYVATTD